MKSVLNQTCFCNADTFVYIFAATAREVVLRRRWYRVSSQFTLLK